MNNRVAFTSVKRSPPIAEPLARMISKESHIFGYEPEVRQLNGAHYLIIRGDGSDDQQLAQRIEHHQRRA